MAWGMKLSDLGHTRPSTGAYRSNHRTACSRKGSYVEFQFVEGMGSTTVRAPPPLYFRYRCSPAGIATSSRFSGGGSGQVAKVE